MTDPGALIFDMDGTLIDNMAYHNRTWLALFESLDLAIDAAEFERLATGKTNREILRQFVSEHLSAAEIAEYGHHKETLYRQLYGPHLQPLPGLHDFLHTARARQIPLALATSAGRTNIDFVLDGIDARGLFDVVVNADDVTNGKPDPEIFLLAAQRLGVPPATCVVFEDSRHGIEAARRAGMLPVLVTTTLRTQDVEGAACAIADYRDLDPADFTPD